MRKLVLCLSIATLGCASDAPAPALPGASSAPDPSGGTSAMAALSASGAPTMAPAKGLPTGDACDTDKDCALSYTYLIDGKCCSGTCSPTALAADTVGAIAVECKARGFEEARCPVKMCVDPKPIGCVDHRCMFVARTGPIESRDDALERATVAANAALDKAYAKSSAQPGATRAPREAVWVVADRATVEGPSAAGGWVFRWSQYPPSGFSHKATVTVDKDGKVTVKEAEAGFSPD